MDQALELQNNQIIFDRATVIFKMQFGLLTEDMIDYLRKLILKPSWVIEARYFRLTRENYGFSQTDIAEYLNISLADLRKLERGVDFPCRDIIANKLKSYLQLN
ncbi:MAG: hypothetical protein HN936_16255 [Bacteroidetes bacterium]|jgi:DNA-binding transcriptional regulator YiaG|nr:hypothetical protein [Bacteroidota bacterium]